MSDTGPTGTLTATEIDTLIALSEVLVDDKDLSDDEKNCIRSHVQIRTENDPGYLDLFQLTSAEVGRLGGGEFRLRSREDRSRLLQNAGFLKYPVKNRESLFPFGRARVRIRMLAIPDLIAGYYRSAAGWATVGYRVFPGQCGELKRYTRPEIAETDA